MICSEKQYLETFATYKSHERRRLQLTQTSPENVKSFNQLEAQLDQIERAMDGCRLAMAAWDAKHASDRKGDWFPVFSGARFWPEDVRCRDINLTDIAHALARTRRWNGHTSRGYSVAQHSVYVSRLCKPEYAMFGLMHDASEAYIQDVVTPIKVLLHSIYNPMEVQTMRAVAKTFEFDLDDPAGIEDVKRADEILLVTEARDITTVGFVNREVNVLPLDETITEFWDEDQAERAFLDRFFEIVNGRSA